MKAGNGWIYGTENPLGCLLWVKGGHVINGNYELMPDPDGDLAAGDRKIPYSNIRVKRLMPAPAGHDYNTVIYKAEKALGRRPK